MKRRTSLLILALAVFAALPAQDKPDALRLYRNGRDLEAAGRTDDAKAAYTQAIDVCKLDLTANPKNMDAYTIYGWSLVRLGKYQETIDLSLESLKIAQDPRVMETIGEAYFFQRNFKDSLKFMEKYVDAAPNGERIATAYFFVGETYRLTKMYNKAEISYSAAVHKEPAVSLWWYRLGSMREALGDKKNAQAAYERALRLRPDYKEASDGLSRVRT